MTKQRKPWLLIVGLPTIAAITIAVACSKGGGTIGPTTVSTEQAVSTPVAVTAPPQTIAPPPAGTPTDEGAYIVFNKEANDCSGTFYNPTGTPRGTWIHYTAPGSTVDIEPKQFFLAQAGGSVQITSFFKLFELCGQVIDRQCDANNGTDSHHLGHAFIRGVELKPCCVEEWIAQEATYEWGEWSECKAEEIPESSFTVSTWPSPAPSPTPPPPVYTKCKGKKTRAGVKTVIEVNSCTEETRTKEGYPREVQQTEDCEFECLAALCHTENDKWCGLKWDWHKFRWEYVCQHNAWNNIGQPDPVKKWQCQNVPPASPGHYPNHFAVSQHDDFFGACSESRCYEIRN